MWIRKNLVAVAIQNFEKYYIKIKQFVTVNAGFCIKEIEVQYQKIAKQSWIVANKP